MKAHKQNKTDAGNGSNGICRVIDASRSPSPDPKRLGLARISPKGPLRSHRFNPSYHARL